MAKAGTAVGGEFPARLTQAGAAASELAVPTTGDRANHNLPANEVPSDPTGPRGVLELSIGTVLELFGTGRGGLLLCF